MSDVDWRIAPGERVGLVGSNGCGKSTLLRAISGARGVDAGRLALAPAVHVGYLEQTAVSGATETVWNVARSRMTDILSAEQDAADAEAQLEAGGVAAANRYANALEALKNAGGYDADKVVAEVLGGLGFTPEDWGRSADEFSGGWQMRIALARLLLSPAGRRTADGGGGLLLLDEPTNHLDAAASAWLAGYLRASPSTLLLVSHDEKLLRGACDRVAEVRGGTLHHYAVPYDAFLQQREERAAQAAAALAKHEAECAKLEGFITRFGAQATKASAAQSKQKALDRLRAAAPTAATPASAAGPGDARKVALSFPKPPPCHAEVLSLRSAAVGWGEPAPGRAPLLSGISITVLKGQRIVVVGPNGAGKSTLLKALAGSVPLWAGTRQEGQGAAVGVFAQDLAQELPMEATPLAHVLGEARGVDASVTEQQGRRALGALGLSTQSADRAISTMSGGEKARVALAAFALRPYNALLLDEASNHLDAGTLQTLTGALQQYGGAIVAITHSESFARHLEPTHIIRVADGTARLQDCYGIEPADFAPAGMSAAALQEGGPATPAAASAEAQAASEADRRRAAQDARKEQQRRSKRMLKLEQLVEVAEARIVELDAQMLACAEDVAALIDLQKDKSQMECDVDEYFEEMEALESQV